MLGMKAAPAKDRIEQFRSDVRQALEEAGKQCALEVARSRKAKEHVTQMIQTVEDLKEKLLSRESEAEELRETISEALARGENVDARIQKRGALLTEAQVIRELIEDMLKKKIPAAREVANNAERSPKGMLLGEITKIRDDFQEGEINQAAREFNGMIKVFSECVGEFINTYPDIMFQQVPGAYIPDFNRL